MTSELKIESSWLSPQTRSAESIAALEQATAVLANLTVDVSLHLPHEQFVPFRDRVSDVLGFLGMVSPMVTPEKVVPQEEPPVLVTEEEQVVQPTPPSKPKPTPSTVPPAPKVQQPAPVSSTPIPAVKNTSASAGAAVLAGMSAAEQARLSGLLNLGGTTSPVPKPVPVATTMEVRGEYLADIKKWVEDEEAEISNPQNILPVDVTLSPEWDKVIDETMFLTTNNAYETALGVVTIWARS